MVTSWPRNLRGPATAARLFAERMEALSQGRLKIQVYPADTQVPAFAVFDAVADGRAELGHSAAYFWSGRIPAAPFFAAVPFGLTGSEMQAWLYRGGGLDLWQELYRPFGVLPLPCGNLGPQMAGWFKREVRQLRDLRGLKMRLPGLGGEVLRRVGGIPVDVRGEELLQALGDGRIDAAEWMSPYNDLDLDLREAARYCHFPGWQEPGCTLELLLNPAALAALPEDVRTLVPVVAMSVDLDLAALYAARNPLALEDLANREQTEFRALPEDVLAALKQAADQVLQDLAARDPQAARIHAAWLAFRERSRQWQRLGDLAFLAARD